MNRFHERKQYVKVLRNWPVYVAITALYGCASGRSVQPDPLASYNPDAIASGAVRDFGVIYRQMGLAAGGTTVSFVGNYAFFASSSPDTTVVMVSLSIPNRGLTFVKDSNSYRAQYRVALTMVRDSVVVVHTATNEAVQVTTFRETNRTDESIIYQHPMTVPPGRYTLQYRVRDVEGGHDASADITVDVPRYSVGVVATPVVVYEGTPRTRLTEPPSYLAAPRASVVFGADSAIEAYVEVEQSKPARVRLSLQNEQGRRPAWIDTLTIEAHGPVASRVVSVPLQHADVGVFHLVVQRVGAVDSVVTPVFIGFGPDLPVVSFTEMLDYLRFFASGTRIRLLRSAPPELRGAAWAKFLRDANVDASRPDNDALRDYFARIRDANQLFRMDAVPGWLSDRGAVYVGLGEPSAAYEQQAYSNGYGGTLGGQYRYLVWEYRDLQARIVFIDEFNSGQWRLLPSSASYFRTLISRIVVQ